MECLRCGENHRLESGPWRQLQSGECPRCGYLGWTYSYGLDASTRRMILNGAFAGHGVAPRLR